MSISLSPTSVTCHSYCCHHQQLNPKPSYFHHLAGVRLEEVHEEASPNYNAIWTTIHHRWLVTRGGLERGSVSQMLRYIYFLPQHRPRSGYYKQILPLTGDVTEFGHAYAISCMLFFMSPLQYNSTFFLFITNNPIRKTFFKWSIITLSIISKVNQHL